MVLTDWTVRSISISRTFSDILSIPLAPALFELTCLAGAGCSSLSIDLAEACLRAKEFMWWTEIRLDVDTVEPARETAIILGEEVADPARRVMPNRCAVSSDSIAR